MTCCIRGATVKALHNSTVKANAMSELSAETISSGMPLAPTCKLFMSPSGSVFECCGIAKAVPIQIDKIEVNIDFYILPTLNSDILIGLPLEKLIQKRASRGSLKGKLGNNTFASPTSCLEIPSAKPDPKNIPFEEVKCLSQFISPEPNAHLCGTE
jgi:hypothetical protein